MNTATYIDEDIVALQVNPGELEHEREIDFFTSQGRVCSLRRPDGADYWLREEYGTKLGEVQEEWKTCDREVYESLWDLLSECRPGYAEEFASPELVLPNYPDLEKLPVGTVFILGINQGVMEPHKLARGFILEPDFRQLLYKAEKEVRYQADAGDRSAWAVLADSNRFLEQLNQHTS